MLTEIKKWEESVNETETWRQPQWMHYTSLFPSSVCVSVCVFRDVPSSGMSFISASDQSEDIWTDQRAGPVLFSDFTSVLILAIITQHWRDAPSPAITWPSVARLIGCCVESHRFCHQKQSVFTSSRQMQWPFWGRTCDWIWLCIN